MSDALTGAGPLTRRRFLQSVSAGGAALVIAVYLPQELLAAAEEGAGTGSAAGAFSPNVFLRIDGSGAVTVTVARTELGQGARTVVPMLVAEELEADWSQVRVEPAVAHPDRYGSMTTGGSTTVRTGWDPLRRAGAAAREMLRQAAAQRWKVPVAECRADQGAVQHQPSGRRLSYGDLVADASRLPVPQEPPLKDPHDWRLIGTSPARLDIPDKVRGVARFGIDQVQPGMLVAAVARCPVFGGSARSWDAAAALAVPGVRSVQAISAGVAVLAGSTWAAMQGRDALHPVWDEGPQAGLNSEAIRAEFLAKAESGGKSVRAEGDFAGSAAGAARRLEADYEVPFLAHAPLEPMNCLAHARAGAVEVWAPTQAPQRVQRAAAGVLDLPPDKVTVHTTLAGGGFGRRLMYDYAIDAAELSRSAQAPVKVVWTRDEDMAHGYYRPASLHRMRAGLDAGGRLIAWRHLVVAPSIVGQNFPTAFQEDEPDAVDGAVGWSYSVPNVSVAYARADTAVPVGWWRSVYNTQNAFANECFLDEIAAAAGADPLEMRRSLLPEDGRHRAELDRVAEVSAEQGRTIRVHRMVCVLDCGVAVHPDQIKAQVEGAVALGLSAALHGEITVQEGRVGQRNYDDYPMLTMETMPEVDVHLLTRESGPGGVGEPPVPPVAPAVGNAVFAATGQRLRRLPFRLA